MRRARAGAEPALVAFPGLAVERRGDEVTLENRAFGTRITHHRDVLALLAFVAQPRTAREIFAAFDFEPAVLDGLREAFVVVPAEELELLRHGVLSPAAPPAGRPVRYAELPAAARPDGIVVLGAPVDLVGSGGAQHGPQAIRSACRWIPRPRPGAPTGARQRVVDMERRLEWSFDESGLPGVLDAGDVVPLPGEGLASYGARLSHATRKIVAHGMRPILLGGDHSVTWFSLQVLLDRHPRLGVIHIDAHHDLATAGWKDRLTHGNPFAYALQHPALARLHQLGLRTIEPRGLGEPVRRDRRVTYVSARELHRLSPAAALRSLPRNIPYYLSFDVDSLAPELAPETGTRVPGGLGYYQALDLVEDVARRFDLVGADFVEVGGPSVGFNQTAEVVARLLSVLLLARARPRRLSSHLP